MPATIAINSFDGTICTLESQPSWNIEDIKVAVQQQCGIPTLEQRLFYKEAEVSGGVEVTKLVFDARSDDTESHAELILVRRSPECAEWIKRIEANVLNFPDAPKNLREDREVVLLALRRKGEYLKIVADQFRADREIVQLAVTADGTALQYASDELRSDRDLVLASFESFTSIGFRFASESIRADHEVALAAVSKNGMTVEYCVGQTRESLKIALAAVTNFPEALEKVAAPFQNNREVVLAAVSKSGIVVRYASEELRADQEVMLAACRSYNEAFQYASTELKNNRDMVLAVLEISKNQLKFASEELQKELAPPAPTLGESLSSTARDIASTAGYVGLIGVWAGNALVGRWFGKDEKEANAKSKDDTVRTEHNVSIGASSTGQ